jgi:hypothetical protein
LGAYVAYGGMQHEDKVTRRAAMYISIYSIYSGATGRVKIRKDEPGTILLPLRDSRHNKR